LEGRASPTPVEQTPYDPGRIRRTNGKKNKNAKEKKPKCRRQKTFRKEEKRQIGAPTAATNHPDPGSSVNDLLLCYLGVREGDKVKKKGGDGFAVPPKKR